MLPISGLGPKIHACLLAAGDATPSMLGLRIVIVPRAEAQPVDLAMLGVVSLVLVSVSRSVARHPALRTCDLGRGNGRGDQQLSARTIVDHDVLASSRCGAGGYYELPIIEYSCKSQPSRSVVLCSAS